MVWILINQLQIGCLPYFHIQCGLSANLECRSEICCTRLAGNTVDKNDAKKSPSAHHHTNLSGSIFATKACIDSRKKVVKQQYLPTCPHNMANFGPLTAEIGSEVWDTPANLNGFLVLAVLLQRRHFMSTSCILLYWQRYCTAVQQRALGKLCGVVQGMELRNFRRGRHLYSAGRPSRWASAHILV